MMKRLKGFGNGTLLMHYNGAWTLYPQQFGADLVAVSMTSATDGWATGYGDSGGSNPHNVLALLHYSNGTWNEYH